MRAKKSLGQNFLKSNMILKKIIEAGEVSSEDIVLEIGPGKGALTEKILENSNHLIALEKDRELFEMLKEKFRKEIKSKSLILLNEDVLDFPSARQDLTEYKLQATSYKLIANIPYNITGAILRKFLSAKSGSASGGKKFPGELHQPERMILMVQNEVAKRIVASDGKESLLSISVKAYGTPKIVMKVPARYFSPAPKVDSAIISITNISRKIFTENKIDEEKFWEIVKAGFAHKRKKLSGNLKHLYQGEPLVSWEGVGDKRAENLTLKEWIKLAQI